MDRLFGILAATGWFLLISVLWLGAVSLSGVLLLQQQFAFNPLLPASWQMLAGGFQRGQAIPLGFILQCLVLLLIGLLGETALLWRLPAIIARLPSLTLPRLSFNLPQFLKPARPKARVKTPAEPVPAPAPTPVPPPSSKAVDELKNNDLAILARILALYEVWDEPPPSWMAEALRDEVHLLSPNAWPTLESLGNHGLDLLLTLQEHGMLPESPAALQAIGEVETILRAGLAAEASLPEASAATIPPLTLAASWLCEALENFLAAQQDESLPEEQLTMAQTMLEQAMKGMNEADWASLDLFPEKASRARVLTDRLREDMRKPPPAKPPIEEILAPPAVAALDPIEAVLALLERLGFSVEKGVPDAPLLAQRPDLLLLLQTLDLKQKSWRLPQGLLGPWSSSDIEIWPGRQLWQLLARRRLRHTDPRPLAGLVILHGGKIEEEETLAQLVAADRRRSAIGLAWLDQEDAALPDMAAELQGLAERAGRERALRYAEGHASAQTA